MNSIFDHLTFIEDEPPKHSGLNGQASFPNAWKSSYQSHQKLKTPAPPHPHKYGLKLLWSTPSYSPLMEIFLHRGKVAIGNDFHVSWKFFISQVPFYQEKKEWCFV